MPNKTGNLVEVGTLIIKIASRCNLACDYCYIYKSKDSSWKSMPRRFSGELIHPTIASISELYNRQETKPNIVLHGGEPLLAGISFVEQFIKSLRKEIPEASVSVQSNGTIYTQHLARILREQKVMLSFSMDGLEEEHNKHRITIKGGGSFNKVSGNLKSALDDGVLKNVLMVVDFENDPARIFEFIQQSGVEEINLILPDGDHNTLPPGTLDTSNITPGEWLWSLFKLYSTGAGNPRIRFFDDIVRMIIKKNRKIKIPPASYSICTLTVDTDGTIKQSDTFRINNNGADYIGGHNIVNVSIVDIANSIENIEYLRKVETLCEKCMACNYLDVCGGGYPSHRMKGDSFLNPSVYCKDYLYLFGKIEAAICATQQG